MLKQELLNTLALSKSFIDVLYLTNEDFMPVEIKKLLKQHKLSFSIRPIEQFFRIREELDRIGTVIIDTRDLDTSQEGYLSRVIESLEMNNIGVVLLNDRLEVPVKSFTLAPSRTSFSMAPSTESVSIDELWTRVSLNLAYRKKSEGIAVKPAMAPKQIHKIYNNKLADQLSMTGAMVDNLSEQLRLAGLVQQDFLPAALPNTDKVRWAASFLPSEWVSGDIYDVVRLDEDHIGFYVADVVGHGIPAALLTIFLKQALVMRETTANSYQIFSPIEVVTRLNVHMAEQRLSGYQFATCCYCLLNTRTLRLTYARAGHPYPMLFRKDGEYKQLEIRGSLLGIFGQTEYVQETIQLRPADKLLLYSDGAEPFIGRRMIEADGFDFDDEFLSIKDLPIVEMFDKFNVIVQTKKINPSEVDDITMVGLEIL